MPVSPKDSAARRPLRDLRRSVCIHICHSRESGNPAFSLWTPALGSRKAGSLAGVTSSVFVFRNRYYLLPSPRSLSPRRACPERSRMGRMGRRGSRKVKNFFLYKWTEFFKIQSVDNKITVFKEIIWHRQKKFSSWI